MRIFPIIPLLILVLVIGVPLSNAQSVPDWVKNTAEWWANDVISEKEFVNAIEFLVNDGIILVEENNRCVNDLLKYFNDEEKIRDVCNEHKSVIHEELIPHDVELKFNTLGLRGEEFSVKKSSDVFRIFIVGGSTMVSAETSNDSTIPSILQKMFESHNLGKEIEVINAGISGGNTITEFDLIKSKLVDYEPDLIITFDGWNDLSADYPVEGTINRWVYACGLGNEENIDVIITLQPIAGFGNKVLTQQEKINSLTGQDHNGFQLIQAKSTYDWYAREMQKVNLDAELQLGKGVCELHDLRKIFDNVYGPIYWDQGHLMHAGNLIIAEKFFELSMQKIDPSFILEQKFVKIISNYNSIPILTFLFNEIGIGYETFQNEPKDTTNLGNKQGKYFHLKNEFGDATMSFVGQDLRDVDLKGVDLKGVDLTGANLSGQDLRDVDLTSTIIRGANLSKTNLEGKDFSGMDLRGIDFSFANLKNVNMIDATISKPLQYLDNGQCDDPSDFVLSLMKNVKCIKDVLVEEEVRTIFHNVDFTNAKFGTTDESEQQKFYSVDFSNAKFTNAEFIEVSIAGSDLSNAEFNNINGKMVLIASSNLENMNMKNFNFDILWIQDSSLTNSEFKNGLIENAFFMDFNMINTDLDGTKITNLIEGGKNDLDCKNHSVCKNS